MSFKLLSISSVYPGYLKSFYIKHPGAEKMSFGELNDLMISETTEFAGSYTRTFRKLGLDVQCIITNDSLMQEKWRSENKVHRNESEAFLLSQVRKYNPDVLWIENTGSVDAAWIRSVRKSVNSIKLVAGYHCSPYNQRVLQTLKSVDLVITCTPGLVDSLREEEINTHLVYHGFDEAILEKLTGSGEKKCDKLLFSGSLFTGGELHNSRIRLVENILKNDLNLELYANLEKGYKIIAKKAAGAAVKFLDDINLGRLAGMVPFSGIKGEKVLGYSAKLKSVCKPPLYGLEMYKLLRNSGIVLNIHLGMAGNYAGNMRMFEVTGVGSCLLTDNKRNISDLFVPGKEVVVYDSPEDCIEKIKWLRDHEEYRSEVAAYGQKKTLESHTVNMRCTSILDIINHHLKSK